MSESATTQAQNHTQNHTQNQTYTTGRTTSGRGAGRGGGRGQGRGSHANQRHTVVASASVPITPQLIGSVVGSQGRTINKIRDATRTRISRLDPDPGNGHLFNSFHITGSPEGVDRARKWILSIIGNTYQSDNPAEFQEENTENTTENTTE